MRRALLAASAALLLIAAPAAAQQAGESSLVARARDVVSRMLSGDVEPLLPSFTDRMKAAIDANGLRRMMGNLIIQAGAFKSQNGARVETRGPIRGVIVSCTFERAEVDMRIAFDPADRLAGIGIASMRPTASYVPSPYATTSAFRDQEITVDVGGWPLPGTLSMPVGDGPFPGVVLVHGSGPNDRDESIGPNKPFRDLAEGLASRGIAVLRYDKRTRVHAQRISTIKNFTVKDEVVDDAVAAVKKLREMPGIRADRVFVLGHSLGGTLIPRIAAADRSIAAVIVMAGAVKSIEQAIVDQTRYLAMLDGTISPEEQSALDGVVRLAAEVRALKTPSDPPIAWPPFSAPASMWLDLRDYNPANAARSLTQSMLILQGERDYQVTMDDFAAWRRALGTRANVTFKSYPRLNHLFMAGSGQSSPAEYMQHGYVDEAVVRDIAAWINQASSFRPQ
jgi:dienelactone hydrolase